VPTEMAQAWHRGVATGFAQSVEGLSQPLEMQPRRAFAHQFWSYEGERPLEYDASQQGTKALFDLLSRADGGIEASPGAMWRRADPFESYKPVSSSRDPEAGAHLDFMYASEAWQQRRPDRRQVLLSFVNKHGLLGLFPERYSGPILPDHKYWLAPDAVFSTREGKLRKVDPATTGKEYLEELLHRRHPDTEKADLGERLAFPHELKFLAKNPISLFGRPRTVSETLESEVVSWEEIKELWGCYVVLDKYSDAGVTLLSTREPLFWWERELNGFPSKERLTAEYGFSLSTISSRMASSVSPRGYLNKHAQAERGWWCPYLLKALYLMLYLDVTGGRSIRRCKRSGCQNYYRAGPQSNSKYCTERCASAASTRMGRGQDP
jgi:hypothetical protein